jgi:hypothetical protein
MSADERLGTSTTLSWALRLAEQELPCFPCRDDKRPATPFGFKNATCDYDTLCQLWRRYPGPLIGVPTGETSGLDILDIDPRHGGESWFAEHKHRLPPTRAAVCKCGAANALIGADSVPHLSELRCESCDTHRGRVSFAHVEHQFAADWSCRDA